MRAAEYQRRKDTGKIQAYRFSKYGLTSEDYDALMKSQDSRCAVCGTDTPLNDKWCIDHDHETGNVRGILCKHCNLAEGHLFGNINIAKAMVVYIERYNAN